MMTGQWVKFHHRGEPEGVDVDVYASRQGNEVSVNMKDENGRWATLRLTAEDAGALAGSLMVMSGRAQSFSGYIETRYALAGAPDLSDERNKP